MNAKFLYQQLKLRNEILKTLIQDKEQNIANAPNGCIYVRKNSKGRKGTQFYYRMDQNDKNGKYIRKSDQAIVPEIVQREYDEKLLTLLKSESELLDDLLSENFPIKIENLYSLAANAKKQLINPVAMADEDYIRNWYMNFEPMGFREGGPEYFSDCNERMRSKSEVLIANQLHRRNIPYQYEPPLIMENGRSFRPDFRVLNIRTGQTFYWEHLGMMGDEEYVRENLQKMREYEKNGFYPGVNLIISYESAEMPYGTRDIERMINAYLI